MPPQYDAGGRHKIKRSEYFSALSVNAWSRLKVPWFHDCKDLSIIGAMQEEPQAKPKGLNGNE